MAEDPLSPTSLRPDPGEARKSSNGAYLPPRKRLLAGLKENGWLSSAPWQSASCNGAPCVELNEEELKLEVDLAETNVDRTKEVQSTCLKQSDCNASSVVKFKRAYKRRKHLSVLADCHDVINHVRLDVLNSPPKAKFKKTNVNSTVAIDPVSTSKIICERKKCFSSYKEMVDAAKAAAERAAKAAAQARAIALDKAATAAKAAAVARAALEAIALMACEEDTLELEPRKHVSKRRRKRDMLKEECKVEMLCLPDVSGTSKRSAASPTCEGEPRSYVELDCTKLIPPAEEPESRSFEHDQEEFPDVKNKEEEKLQANHHSNLHVCSPVADVELARQLHRAMNSSPRISCNKQSSGCIKKSETKCALPSKSCFRKKFQPPRGFKVSMEGNCRQKIHRITGTNRMLGPRAEVNVKVKSMSAINKALNMLQGASSSH